jgi:hypothetical protein
LWKDVPDEHRGDFDFIISSVDWDKNTSPEFFQSRFSPPVPLEDRPEECQESWIVYRSRRFSAKELTVLPGRRVVLQDSAAYGCIAVQGRGSLGRWTVETPTLIRYGELTSDEFFVSEQAAKTGVGIANSSDTEPLVILKHFGPNNPENSLAE